MKTRDLCALAVMSATLTGGKLTLSFIPNVEIVTLLLIAYSLVLGVRRALFLSLVFVIVECLIYGIGIWSIAYALYWCPMSVCSALLAKIRVRKTVVTAALGSALGIVFTVCFGVLTTALEVALMGGMNSSFWLYFSARYASGLPFFVTHIVSNCIVLPLALPPLYVLCKTLTAE